MWAIDNYRFFNYRYRSVRFFSMSLSWGEPEARAGDGGIVASVASTWGILSLLSYLGDILSSLWFADVSERAPFSLLSWLSHCRHFHWLIDLKIFSKTVVMCENVRFVFICCGRPSALGFRTVEQIKQRSHWISNNVQVSVFALLSWAFRQMLISLLISSVVLPSLTLMSCSAPK